MRGNYGNRAKVAPFFAQVWNPLHEDDELSEYPKEVSGLDGDIMTYYLAIDIGASSGRRILGSVKDGKIQLEEIYRFENSLEKHGDSLCWNIEKLFFRG